MAEWRCFNSVFPTPKNIKTRNIDIYEPCKDQTDRKHKRVAPVAGPGPAEALRFTVEVVIPLINMNRFTSLPIVEGFWQPSNHSAYRYNQVR